MGLPPDWDDEATSDDDLPDAWYVEQEPEWERRRQEASTRFPVGCRVRDPHGNLGVVVAIDALGELMIDMPPDGVGVWSAEWWDGLTVEPRA